MLSLGPSGWGSYMSSCRGLNALPFCLIRIIANDALTRDLHATASAIGKQVEVLTARSSGEIDAAFASLAQRPAAALVVTPDQLLDSRRVQLVTLATHYRLPAIYPFRENVEIGGLMSYGSSAAERDRQVGIYTGRILKGEKPADLP